jgi:hypothetical protein
LRSSDEADIGRDGAQAEQPATFSGMGVAVVTAILVVMGRSIPMDVYRPQTVMVVGQARRRPERVAESQDGSRRR